MWWRSAVGAIGTLAFAPGSSFAVDRGRLGLLAREAADTLATPPAHGLSAGLIAVIVVGAFLAALLGAWIGLRVRSTARLRERQGWRELTYRFRSPHPMRVDGDIVGRMTGVLDELEEFCRRFKTTTPRGALAPAVTFATAGAPLAAAESLPVRFARRTDTENVRARWSPGDAPSTGTPAAPKPRAAAPVVDAIAPSPSPVAAPAAVAVATPGQAPVAAAVPPARLAETAPSEGRDRNASYRAARRLLEAGHDREDVRRRTGLKLAEIDLLRCAPGGPR
ncbi:MAG: hypothetical protein U0167_16575 [bacterium]